MRLMKNILFGLALATSCVMQSMAQQNPPSDAADHSAPTTFAQAVNQYFDQWDANRDGKLSKEEIDAAVNNPKVQGDSAAAIAAVEKVVRGGKYTIPAITKEFLVNSPVHEPDQDDQAGSADDDSKSEKFTHAPAFQPRFVGSLHKLRQTSRDLFSQNLPSFEATHQGKLGDCPFVSTVGAMVYRDPATIKAMFTQNDNGSITVQFGNGRSIKIAHITDADIAIWSSAGSNGLWLTVLEKAYRREVLKSQPPKQEKKADIYEKFPSTRTIEILDGHQTRKVDLRGAQLVTLRKDLESAMREHRLVKAGTGAVKKAPGIPHTHSFAILGYNIDTDMVHVWNPWGNDISPKADSLQNGYTTKHGLFDIPLKELVQVFKDVTFETPALERN